MNAALWLALAFSSNAAECRECHPAIVEAYQRTGMGRSVSLFPQPADARYYHRLSNRHYTIAGGKMRRHQLNAGRGEVNVIEKSIDVAIGSGNHAITYVHRSPEGRLIELPVSSYTLDGWAMSPGYDKPDHLDFRREVNDSCLFCHSDGKQPAPIGCGRCHGDGAAHSAKPSRANIVNPKRLTPERQLDVCLQCHLETASSGFPDSLRKPGRDVFAFKPGEALTDYKVYFDRPNTERFEVNHAGYGMLQSRCFTASGGKLTCLTCHAAHTFRARRACNGCHNSEHSREATDCESCHMTKGRTHDAPHVAMTNHWIALRPGIIGPQPGDLTIFRGTGMLDLARTKLTIESGRGAEADYRRWLALEPQSPAALAALGEALMRFGKRAAAKGVLERARKADPRNVTALNALAVYHATDNRLSAALQLLEQARTANPDHPLTWINLGVTHEAMGDRAKAEQAYREAIRHQPDSAEARRRLAALR